MNKKIGFLGCGNMGKAMLNGLISSNYTNVDNIMVSTRSEESKSNMIDEFKVKCTLDNIEVAKFSDILFLAIKPNIYKKVINEIKENLKKDIIIVSIAAGINLSDLEEWLDKDYKIVKTMPNTPALVGEGMSAICPNLNVNKEELRLICNIFKNFGKYEILEEKYFDGFIALCGSSPAYVFMFIEAMADAAVLAGMPRNQAYTFAAQAVMGSAKMVLETGKHPGELKDMVCSPGGTTIEAVKTLEEEGFRSAVIKAIGDCIEKSKEMSK